METPHPRLLILATALICSAGMGLPISGLYVPLPPPPPLLTPPFAALTSKRAFLSHSILAGYYTDDECRINVEDDMGQRYLEPSDFFKNGIPASIVAVTVIITLGYVIMRLMGM